jgi:predicted nucleic acid-binding protein
MSPVLLDAGCIVALLDRSEQHHHQCAEVVAEIGAPLVTCEAVLAEACYLLRRLKGASAAILQNVERGNFSAPFRLAENAGAVSKLLKKYADVPMDLADACLVDMAASYRTGRILTLDSDFKVYRWGKNRPFELLLDF